MLLSAILIKVPCSTMENIIIKKYWGRFKYEYNLNKYIKLRSNVYVGRKKVTEPYNIDHLAWLTYWT